MHEDRQPPRANPHNRHNPTSTHCRDLREDRHAGHDPRSKSAYPVSSPKLPKRACRFYRFQTMNRRDDENRYQPVMSQNRCGDSPGFAQVMSLLRCERDALKHTKYVDANHVEVSRDGTVLCRFGDIRLIAVDRRRLPPHAATRVPYATNGLGFKLLPHRPLFDTPEHAASARG